MAAPLRFVLAVLFVALVLGATLILVDSRTDGARVKDSCGPGDYSCLQDQ
jgi:hypothetical protein